MPASKPGQSSSRQSQKAIRKLPIGFIFLALFIASIARAQFTTPDAYIVATASATPSDPDQWADGFVSAINAPRLVIFHNVPQWALCSCVEFARFFTGHADNAIPYGNAWDIKANTAKPAIGDWILTNEGRGHVAVIADITATGSFETQEANWTPCHRISRTIPANSKLIRGFFHP